MAALDGHRALVALRDAKLSARVARSLRRSTGWTIASVDSGDAALRACATAPFDVFLLDDALSVVSGLELARVLRQRDRDRELTIVLRETWTNGSIDESAALDAGVDEVVAAAVGVRPLVARIVIRTLRRALGPFARGRVRFSGGRLYADFDAAFVTVDGHPITLPIRDLAMLRYFVEHQNELVTREELLRAVWANQPGPRRRTVDAHVARLRARLGVARSSIRTITPYGYLFAAGKSV